MTENLFARLTGECPVDHDLCYTMEFSQKVVICCMLLSNYKARKHEEEEQNKWYGQASQQHKQEHSTECQKGQNLGEVQGKEDFKTCGQQFRQAE